MAIPVFGEIPTGTGTEDLDTASITVDTGLSGGVIFGDGDTLFYESSDDVVEFRTAGTDRLILDAAGMRIAVAGGGSVPYVASTDVIPAHSFAGDSDTGVGRAGADQLSLTAGGEEVIQVNTGGSALLRAGDGSDTAKLGGVLDVNTTQYSTPADTDEHDAITYELKANTLNTDGKMLRVTAFGISAANANNKRVRLYLGSTVISDNGVWAMNNADWMLTSIVIRTGTSAQKAIGHFENNGGINHTRYYTPTEDEAASLIVKITAENAVATAADIVVEGMIVELLN